MRFLKELPRGPLSAVEGWLFIGMLVVTSPPWLFALGATAACCWLFQREEE